MNEVTPKTNQCQINFDLRPKLRNKYKKPQKPKIWA